MLRAKRDALVPLGLFDAWLRQNGFRRNYAYRLIHRGLPVGCSSETSLRVPVAVLRRDTLTLRLSAKEFVVFHRVLGALAAQDNPVDFIPRCLRCLVGLTSGQPRRELDEILDTPAARFSPEDAAALAPLRFGPRLQPFTRSRPPSLPE